MTIAYIALGSNLDGPQQHIERAPRDIAALAKTTLLKTSPLYRTAPIGPAGQPDFINAVCSIETALPPTTLLQALQQIEQQHGRLRKAHWGPRTLDLDILLYGRQHIATDALQVPHPRMAERNFVLKPLLDLDDTLRLPDGTPLAKLLANCPANGIVRI